MEDTLPAAIPSLPVQHRIDSTTYLTIQHSPALGVTFPTEHPSTFLFAKRVSRKLGEVNLIPMVGGSLAQ